MSDIITVTTETTDTGLTMAGGSGALTATGWRSKAQIPNKYKKILFIDVAAEVSDTDIRDLEEAGFKVVKVVGCPHQTVCPVNFY